MLKSAAGICRRGYTCLFVNLGERHPIRRYESTSATNQKPEKTSEKDDDVLMIDNTDATILSKNQIPRKEHMDMLIGGIPYKEIPIIHIRATGNNTLITAEDNGRTFATASGGTVGYKNAKKGSTIAAQTVAMEVAQKALFKEYKTVRVCLQGLGPGRLIIHEIPEIGAPGKKPAVKALQTAGLNIISITDTTKFGFNGNRPRKAPRK